MKPGLPGIQPPPAPPMPAGVPMAPHPIAPPPMNPLEALLGGGHAGPMGGPPVAPPAVNDAKGSAQPKAVLSRFGGAKKKKHKKPDAASK